MLTFASYHHLSCVDKVKKACSRNTALSQLVGWMDGWVGEWVGR